MKKYDIVGRAFATYSKHKTVQVRILLGSVVTLAFSLYAIFSKFQTNPISGEDFEMARTVAQYIAYGTVLAIGKVLYDMYLDMPYLHFTEDRFYFEEDEPETGGYWREVVSIDSDPTMLRGLPTTQMTVCITYGKNKKFVIDPAIVNLQGTDVQIVAKEFWQSALEKLD